MPVISTGNLLHSTAHEAAQAALSSMIDGADALLLLPRRQSQEYSHMYSLSSGALLSSAPSSSDELPASVCKHYGCGSNSDSVPEPVDNGRGILYLEFIVR